MTKEGLKALDYPGIPVEVCEAAYETIKAKGYKTALIKTDDTNLLEWMILAGIKQAKTKAQFGFIDSTVEDPLRYIPYVSKEIAFYGITPAVLRAYFNQSVNYDAWSTVEIPIGDGLFVAVKL